MNLWRICAPLALLAFAPLGYAAPALVQSATPVVSSTLSQTSSLSGVASGNYLLVISSVNANEAVTLSDSTGDTVTTAVSGNSSAGFSYGWNIACIKVVTAGAHTITASVGTADYVTLYLSEWSGLSSCTADAAPAVVENASSLTFTTPSATPTASGDLAVAAFFPPSTNVTYSSWTNGFSQQQTLTGPGTGSVWASLVYSGTAALTASATASATHSYRGALVLFSPAGGPSITHECWTSSGTIIVPTAGSTLCWLKNGIFGTVDGSTTQYYQPKNGGAFGVN